jgi:hypothetical protein
MSHRRSTAWLRHPPADITRTYTCPTGYPRHATESLARGTALLAVVTSGLRPFQCDQCHGGWHLIPAEETTS